MRPVRPGSGVRRAPEGSMDTAESTGVTRSKAAGGGELGAYWLRTGDWRMAGKSAAMLPMTKRTDPTPYCTAACHTGLSGRKHHHRMRASKRYAALVHGSYPAHLCGCDLCCPLPAPCALPHAVVCMLCDHAVACGGLGEVGGRGGNGSCRSLTVPRMPRGGDVWGDGCRASAPRPSTAAGPLAHAWAGGRWLHASTRLGPPYGGCESAGGGLSMWLVC